MRSVKEEMPGTAFAGVDGKLGERLAEDFAHGLPGHFISDIEGVEVYYIPGIAFGFGNHPFVRPNLGLPR